MTDLLLVNPGIRARTYGELASSLSGIEPPFWAGLVASFVRNHGYSIMILDAEAEGWSPEYTAERIVEINPKLVAMIVQGANPSASSTPKMTATGHLLRALKEKAPTIKTILGGIHPSALPERTLREEEVDFVCQGEPFHTILDLLGWLISGHDSRYTNGLWYIKENLLFLSPRPGDLLGENELPPVAWDLLDMTKYRCHNWHALSNLAERSPYAVLYTSFGCVHNCDFCDIHTLFGGDRHMRHRNLDEVINELDLLVNKYGVRKIKIMDEMFALNEKRVIDLCDRIIKRGYDLDMWAYARVDTVTKPMLAKMKEAGINWIGYGLEAGSDSVRSGVGKRFTSETIDRAIKMAREVGMYIMPAFIFGLPDDDLESMQATLDMAKHYNFEYLNFYCATGYPGSKLWEDAVKSGVRLPETWEGYGQLSYDFVPLPTKHLSSEEVLRFRDNAFQEYFNRVDYLEMIKAKFGDKAVEHIKSMLEYKIRRRLLE